MNRRWFGRCVGALAAGGLLAGGLSGCGGGSGESRFLFITNSNADWWNAVEKGMQDGGEELDCVVEMHRNEHETPGQIRLLEDAIGRPDVVGVAVSVYEAGAPGIVDALKALKDAGKIVITIDSDLAEADAEIREAYIGTDNFEAGKAAGRAAQDLRPDGGTVCVFVGTSSAANARARRDGFFAGAGDKFKQQEIFDDNSDHAKASSNVQTALSKYSDVGVLLGLWSYNAAPIAEEVAGLPSDREKPTVVTFDLDELAVDMLDQEKIDVTVCQNPYMMGYLGVRLLKAIHEGDDKTKEEILPDGETRDTGVRVVVPTADSPVKGEDVMTIEEMKAWLDSKGLKST